MYTAATERCVYTLIYQVFTGTLIYVNKFSELMSPSARIEL